MAGTLFALAVNILLLAPAIGTPQGAAPAGGQKVNADARVMADFEARVKAYSDLHRKLEATLPNLPKETTPTQISQHQLALAQLIAHARSGAQFGDIFTKETRALFRRYLARVFVGREGAELKARHHGREPGQAPAARERPVPGIRSRYDRPDAGAADVAQAPRGSRVSIHRRSTCPSRHPRGHDCRRDRERLPEVDSLPDHAPHRRHWYRRTDRCVPLAA